MSRIVRSFHWSFRVSKSQQPAIATALLALALSSAGLVGCSSDEPPPAAAGGNQPQAGSPPAAAPNMVAMPDAGGAAAPGAANPNAAGAVPTEPGGAPNANAAFPTAPGGAAFADGAVPTAPGGVPNGIGAVPTKPGAEAVNPSGAGVPPVANPQANANFQAGAVVPNAGAGAPEAAGAQPGAAGVPGAGGLNAGGPNGGQGVPQNPQSPVGTAEFAAESIAIQALKGDVSSLEQFISPKCKGLLGDIREGKATEKQIDELKKLFVGVKPVGVRNENGTRVLTVRNADNATISFKVKKEGDDFKVQEMTVKPGTTKKSR